MAEAPKSYRQESGAAEPGLSGASQPHAVARSGQDLERTWEALAAPVRDATPKKKAPRLAFIDWTRGIAAFTMLQGHSFHSFTRNDLRNAGPYILSQFFGGEAQALFLFITGITFAFLMDSRERQGLTAYERVKAAFRRSGYLFGLAFLFRISLFLLGFPGSPASELLRVDILNCMGMATLLLAPMAVFSTLDRIRLCTILGVIISALSPLISQIGNNGLPWLVQAYFVPSFNYFSFFPWAAFLAFGMAAGSVFRLVKTEDMGKVMQWMMLIGLGLVVGGQYFSGLPYSVYTKSEYWLDSPGLAAIKLGAAMAIMAFAWVWANGAIAHRWSLLRQLGTTSLLVYWVHIELVYGRWFGIWKESLTLSQVTIFSIVLIALMTALSIARTRWKTPGSFFRSTPVPTPGRASGD